MAKAHNHEPVESAHHDEDHGKKDLIAYLIVAGVLAAAAYLYYTKAI